MLPFVFSNYPQPRAEQLTGYRIIHTRPVSNTINILVLSSEVVVSDICESQQLTSQSGYIRTPSYPSNYHRQGKCSTTITAHPSQRLTLYIIDMELESRGTADCADQLYFNDKLRSITLCGSRNNNTYHMHTNFLHIELKSSSGGHSKGFWLYYEG